MSRKIIKPEGEELLRYLNEGYPICNECGAVMDRKDGVDGDCDMYTCPSCGWAIDVMDYEYEDSDEDEPEWTSEMLKIYKGDVPPSGCRACGGPYPHCKTSCRLFDD